MIFNEFKNKYMHESLVFTKPDPYNQNYYNPPKKQIQTHIAIIKPSLPQMITKPAMPAAPILPSQQSQPNQQSDFQYILNLNDLMDYFKSIKVSSVSEKKSDFYTYEKFISVTELIYNDEMQIGSTCVNVDSLLVREKISQQEEKANELKAKKTEILQQLALLDSQVSRSKRQTSNSKGKINLSMDASRVSSKDNEEQQQLNTKKLIFSKHEHKQLVLKIVKERQQRERNRLMMKQKQQERLKKLQEQQSQLQARKIEQQKRKKAQQIEQKLKKKRQMHEKFLQQEKQSQRKVNEIKHKKFLYEQISQKFQLKVKMPFLEEQKKILRQKRQFAKAYSIDEIKNHEKAYLELRQNSMKKSQAKQPVKSSDQNYKAPMKSSRLEKILQDQQLEQRKKLMDKKRAIQQKLQRQENYVDYLKENFSKIKIDKSKQQEIKKRIQKLTVKRQEIDSRAIGMGYLEQAKKLRKKTAQPAHETQKQQAVNENQKNITVLSQPKKAASQSRIEDQRRNNLMKKRQQKIQILIHDSTLNQTEKIKKLKMETEKINEAFKMKEEMLKYGYSEKVEEEAVELLLTSIQAKMGIIDITKERSEVAG